MIGRVTVPGDLAVENDVVDRQRGDGRRDPRKVLFLLRTREKPDGVSLLECDEANAVEFALEAPVGARKALLSERRGHRLDPVGKTRVGQHGARGSRCFVDRRVRRPVAKFGNRLRPSNPSALSSTLSICEADLMK